SSNVTRQYATTAGSETLSNKTLINPSLGTSAIASTFVNETSTGTQLNSLAKLTGSPSSVIKASTTDTAGIVGVVVGGAGTTGAAAIAVSGQANCVFDGATTSGD